MKQMKNLEDGQGMVTIQRTKSGDFIVETDSQTTHAMKYTCKTLDALCLVLEGRFSRDVLVNFLSDHVLIP